MKSDEELLDEIIKDGSVDIKAWPEFLPRLINRLDHICHNSFPLPQLPPLSPPAGPTAASSEPVPTLSRSSTILTQPPEEQTSQEPPISSTDTVLDKENVPLATPSTTTTADSVMTNATSTSPQPATQVDTQEQTQQTDNTESIVTLPEKTLLPSLYTAMQVIKASLENDFSAAAPYTAQRLAELLRNPNKHYKSLPKYLRALERVVSVTSTVQQFPLPVISDGSVSNSVPLGSAYSLGSDESLGGALLTPIAWESARAYINNDRNGRNFHAAETSMNGVTQGELLRQEQELGVVPMSQLIQESTAEMHDAHIGQSGPPDVGAEDVGPQPEGVSFATEEVKGEAKMNEAMELEDAKLEIIEEEKRKDVSADDMDVDGGNAEKQEPFKDEETLDEDKNDSEAKSPAKPDTKTQTPDEKA